MSLPFQVLVTGPSPHMVVDTLAGPWLTLYFLPVIFKCATKPSKIVDPVHETLDQMILS